MRGSERISQTSPHELFRRIRKILNARLSAVSGSQRLPAAGPAQCHDCQAPGQVKSRNLIETGSLGSLPKFVLSDAQCDCFAFWLCDACLLTYLRPRGKGRKLAWQGAWHENTMMLRMRMLPNLLPAATCRRCPQGGWGGLSFG